MASDFRLFMTQLLKRPHQVVALAPSSEGLAREMAARVDPAAGPVIELGAGTGKITRAILDRGLPPEQLHSIEMNPVFCDRLRAAFPGLNVYQISAGDVGTLPVEDAQAVISGLPLLSMPVALQRAILTGTVTKVRPGCDYVQFTYGPKPPVTPVIREELGLSWDISHKIWWNMPPARVYRFRQATAEASAAS
ncbi:MULTISPECIES: class I SAM-dependent methyltransferase [Paracoccaceae]|jgi:phosphatidylethanolamine/phosphatidyl-N-methylethanolamine N-methyltransferase|uniref:class I SAM-dependent methyltransferase n=1 Tax=Rhodobacterales TaxID=204455 RepID=UPI001B0F6ACA|nr:methyltransferase type 12 [Boseongicola sp. H5]MBO6603546.1 methyltransferase type 12 [Roseicyclus sp.]MBO6626101.1 methyltransferase type 12 [Roseicyclus sp.]MBO6924103.1 methyltransferase type 12 [Roseicyclus sp.]